MSNYFVKTVLDQWFGLVTATPPATVYIVMFTTDPGLADSGGVEVTGGGYVRLAVTNNATNFPATVLANRQKNGGWGTPFTWFTASGTLGPIVATGVRDASSGGNLLLLNSIASGSQQTLTTGNQITFNAADFSWRID